uniref:Uncharacterized protein n=1 Tax=Chromera velia CCMP2878 TaxID=1169474 RepID=A0A0G4HU75_9ALVE|eukprot:Cvel_31698.t1-p1 / transcript=Cvel_31698.t1 / gene=Cvel_31698 / organism=Chromera_velia_CCMP2878 / gene_product=hypothetical protein / transcript_product=hypothetical protein / location=Cvel_scaffold4773:788-4662(+) / protein_length=268 / sequence_SO=supercontig / SO=protein_coding / is_pseudo=false
MPSLFLSTGWGRSLLNEQKNSTSPAPTPKGNRCDDKLGARDLERREEDAQRWEEVATGDPGLARRIAELFSHAEDPSSASSGASPFYHFGVKDSGKGVEVDTVRGCDDSVTASLLPLLEGVLVREAQEAGWGVQSETLYGGQSDPSAVVRISGSRLPVVMLSVVGGVEGRGSLEAHVRLGESLQTLRAKDVLIIGLSPSVSSDTSCLSVRSQPFSSASAVSTQAASPSLSPVRGGGHLRIEHRWVGALACLECRGMTRVRVRGGFLAK